jgi:hypothetical protein
MSYLMILRMQVNPDDLERAMQENGDTVRGVQERSKEFGAIHHAFYVGDGEALVVDEWDTPESFQKFFEAEQPNIGPLLQAAGIQAEPQISFFRKLETVHAF